MQELNNNINNQPPIQQLPPTQPQPQPQVIESPPQKSTPWVIYLIALLIILAIAGAVYFFVFSDNFDAPYGEHNLVSGVVDSISRIDSARNVVAINIFVTDRDADARPFDIKPSDFEDLKLKYERDATRANSVSRVLSLLTDYLRVYDKYPASLGDLETAERHGYSLLRDPNMIRDPLTKNYFEYSATEDGQNYTLVVNFETQEVVEQINDRINMRQSFASPIDLDDIGHDQEPVIDGTTITFSNLNGYVPLWISRELPKTFYEQVADSLSFFPPETNISASLTTEVERKGDDVLPTNFYIRATGEGDLGDMIYRVDLESIKAEGSYFFRINNIPSIMLSFAGFLEKGKWIKMDATDDPYSMLPDPKEFEEAIVQMQAETKKATEIIVRVADEEKLFSFKSAPKRERVGSETLYKYSLDINEENFRNFYKKLTSELESDPDTKMLIDQSNRALIRFLDSDNYSEVFNFYRENLDFVLWVDRNGNPARFKMSARIVPNDDNYALRNKQVMFVVEIALEDINKGFDIKAPQDFMTMDEIFDRSGIVPARSRGEDAMKKANLNNLRAQAELYYDTDGNNSYSGVCDSERAITMIEYAEAVCFDESLPGIDSGWAANTLLSSGYYYCVDSTGLAVESTENDINESDVSCL